MGFLARALNRGWKFFYRREWAMFTGAVVFILTEITAIADLITEGTQEFGDKWNWAGVLVIAQAVLTRRGVFSRQTVEELSTGT